VRCAILVVSLVWSSAWAQGGPDDLKRCLADLGGIAWRFPYSPRVSVTSCISPAGSYQPRPRAPAGIRELSLGASYDRAPDEDRSLDERTKTADSAALAHFDALFRRHGYLAVSPGRYSRGDGMALVWKAEGSNRWVIVVEGAP
jgi:hypothetical protein